MHAPGPVRTFFTGIEDVLGPVREQLPVFAGAPSNPQMIGIGYRRAMSATASQRPVMVTGSTNSVMTSTIVLCSRAVDRGVNAWETSRRSRL